MGPIIEVFGRAVGQVGQGQMSRSGRNANQVHPDGRRRNGKMIHIGEKYVCMSGFL